MIIKYSQRRIFTLVLCLIHITHVIGYYRENLALRLPCTTINKRLEPFITWTEKLASSQYKVQKDGCGQIGIGPVCCTDDIINSYITSLGVDLQNLIDTQLDNLTTFLSISSHHIAIWSHQYITESHRLTVSSLETLFSAKEYRSNIHYSVTNLFNTLSNSYASVDSVAKSTMDLFNHLIISLYRRFIINNDEILLDETFQKCLVNKAFNIEALPKQRELLYILTSSSSLVQIFHTMLIYIQADIQRLKTTSRINTNQCIQRYARETLCPICVSASSSFNKINHNNDISEALCEKDCRYLIKTCFNEINEPYSMFASIAKNYSEIVEQIEQAVIELKLVERLAKIHIYLYDMVVNVTNSRQIYKEIQSACPNHYVKSFSPILSLPPVITERRELVTEWNRSLNLLLKRTHSSLNHFKTKFTNKLMTEICSNSNYATKSNGCTQIDKQSTNLIQWSLPLISKPTLNVNNAEQTRNQIEELKKKMTPIQQMITSLKPKQKISLIQYIPDFESYNDEITGNDYDAEFSALIETYDGDIQGSLSERIYKEIEGRTTRRSNIRTNQKPLNTSTVLQYHALIHLMAFMIQYLRYIQ